MKGSQKLDAIAISNSLHATYFAWSSRRHTQFLGLIPYFFSTAYIFNSLRAAYFA
jgi:hypothetical protein